MNKLSGHELNLSKLPKELYQRRDVLGRTLLHIAVLANDVSSFRKLLRSSEARNALLAIDYESGWNVLHYIFFYKRLGCLNVLLEYFELNANGAILAELLKRKDRSRLPPLALLQNDLKDLVWVPSYINERNEFHLQRRFDTPKDEKNPTQPYLPRYIDHDWWLESRGGLGIYVFGSNTSNQLGVGDSADRSIPSRLNNHEFHIEDSSDADVRQLLQSSRFRAVKLSKYHSAILTLDGRLFTCGMGSRGRLGHGNVANLFRFKHVDFSLDSGDSSDTIEKLSISNNHNLVLTSENNLYTWGLNTYNQLGYTSVSPQSFKNISEVYENAPKVVNGGDLRKRSQRIIGIEVSKIHSLAYSSSCMYFWGLNIGQMGLPTPDLSSSRDNDHRVNGQTYKGNVVALPKEVPLKDIKLVSTCETCTCAVTTANEIYVYFLGQRVKLPKLPARAFSEAKFDCFKPSRLTKASAIKKVVLKSHDNIHILLESGDVIAFRLSLDDSKSLRNVRYTYVWRAYDSDMRAVDIDNSYDGSLIVCTKNGSVFVNYTQTSSLQSRGSMSTQTMPTFSSSTKKKFKKVEHVNRILRVSCDESFTSFSMIRDDVDLLPLKLQKNDLFVDMESLSVLTERDLYRKQDQLLDTDHEDNCYITDYLYPTDHSSLNEDEHSYIIKQLGNDFTDLKISEKASDVEHDNIRLSQQHRFDPLKNQESPWDSFYQLTDPERSKSMTNTLKSETEIVALLTEPNIFDDRFCEGRITLSCHPDISIGMYPKLLEYRSSFCKQIFNPKDDGEYFIHEGIKGSYDRHSKTLHFDSDVDLRAILILLHFLYTNNTLSFWEQFPSGLKCPEGVRKVKSDFMKLMDLFRMDSLYGKREAFVSQLAQMADDKTEGDVTVSTKDGEEFSRASILVTRSAFFETILSDRWEQNDYNSEIAPEGSTSSKYVSLDNISLLQYEIISHHLHGCMDLRVFEPAQALVADSNDSDDFVNFLLDMIEISDELLLVQLKHLCELAIKEFINIENVLILLAHADWLGAHKLFMSCCWYIYNNLEIVVFNKNMCDLGDELVSKLETQIRFLQNCRSPDFVLGEKGEVNLTIDRNWLELTDVSAVENFISDPTNFNEIYMSDRRGFSSFEPLRDVKLETTTGEESRRKLSARRMSRRSSNEPLAELRKLSFSLMMDRKVSESVIVDEEEFEVVTNRKRKSKLKPKFEEAPSEVAARFTKEISTSPTLQVQQPPLPIAIPDSNVPRMEATSSVGSASNSAASFAWVSRNSSSVSVSKVQPNSIARESNESLAKQTKIKFPPSMKLSQKQRKKLAQQEPLDSGNNNGNSSNALELRNPWKVASAPEKLSSARPDDGNLPILGAPKKEVTPSLTAIMLQESTRVEEQKIQDTVQRTLQEVQQEQEFAKWWAEESKKVQSEMTNPFGYSPGSSLNGGKSRSNGHGKQRRGSRKKSSN